MEHFLASLPAIISGITVLIVGFIAKGMIRLIKDTKHNREINEQSLMWQLRAVIWSPYYSFDEKRIAFEEYRARGGNSLTAEHFRELERQQINETKGRRV